MEGELKNTHSLSIRVISCEFENVISESIMWYFQVNLNQIILTLLTVRRMTTRGDLIGAGTNDTWNIVSVPVMFGGIWKRNHVKISDEFILLFINLQKNHQ